MAEKIIRKPNTPGRIEDGFRILQGKQEYINYLEGSTFRYWYSDIPWRYETHCHSAVEIILTLEGCVTYEVEGQKYDVMKDEVLIIPPGLDHALSMGGNSRRHLFLFEPDAIFAMADFKLLMKGFQQVFYLRDNSQTHRQIRDLLLRAVRIYQEQDTMWNTICYSLMMKMYATLGQSYLSGLLPTHVREPIHGNTEIITGMMTYINNHYMHEMSLEQAAEAAGFSKFYFSRFFKAQTGYTFHEFLCQKRLQAAMEMLISSRKPMKQVAEESGFGSVATFNRIFREYKKCTPTQYRAIYATY